MSQRLRDWNEPEVDGDTVFPLIEAPASIRTIVSDPRLLLETRLVLETRLLSEPPGSPMNMILFKTPRFLALYLLLQNEIPVLLNANHALRTDDAMHHSATGDAQLVL